MGTRETVLRQKPTGQITAKPCLAIHINRLPRSNSSKCSRRSSKGMSRKPSKCPLLILPPLCGHPAAPRCHRGAGRPPHPNGTGAPSALQVLDHKARHIHRVLGGGIGRRIGKVKLRQLQSCHFCANGRCQYINALVNTIAANDLRTQQPQAFFFSYSTFIVRPCAGIIGSVGCREKYDFVVSDL